ncbi:MAG: hypothetical protein KDA80_15570 [Planctomycetaceae bacterium]|nr:hypothetical protein [Planctomycetaceae bacterium]
MVPVRFTEWIATRRRCQSLLVLWLTIFAGCSESDSRSTERLSSREQESRFRSVAAEDWARFATEDQDSVGWIALPEPVSKPLFQSQADPSALGIVGPEACSDCHAEQVLGFLQTAHALTSRAATPETVLGPLDPPRNSLETRVDGFSFETKADGERAVLVTVTYPTGKHTQAMEFPLAFAVGSGNHGQSYLIWHGDQLCQSPVSYFSEKDCWSNSPGTYKDGTADFARPATTRCLDCHNTWVAHAPGTVNRYDAEHSILGVTCVRCHGPAKDHMTYHRMFPHESHAQAIVNPGRLDRQRSLEVCAQCHSGGGELLRPAFTFRPGERLDEWIQLDLNAQSPDNDDPHSANQLGRLMRSRCFQESESLTCASCHDPHRPERGDSARFSKRCLSCHQVESCGLAEKSASAIQKNCVDCHMPTRRDAQVAAQGVGDPLLPLLRDHQIAIWYDVSRVVQQRFAVDDDQSIDR